AEPYTTREIAEAKDPATLRWERVVLRLEMMKDADGLAFKDLNKEGQKKILEEIEERKNPEKFKDHIKDMIEREKAKKTTEGDERARQMEEELGRYERLEASEQKAYREAVCDVEARAARGEFTGEVGSVGKFLGRAGFVLIIGMGVDLVLASIAAYKKA